MYLGKNVSTFLSTIKVYGRNSSIWHYDAPHEDAMNYLTKGPGTAKASSDVWHLCKRANCYWGEKLYSLIVVHIVNKPIFLSMKTFKLSFQGKMKRKCSA